MNELDELVRFAPWRLMHDAGDHIDLITPTYFKTLPAGTVLMSIEGRVVVVGQDEIDQDTRFGFLAFGIPCSETHDPPYGVYGRHNGSAI